MSLADFFGQDFVFIAYGNEKFSHDDFDLTSNGKAAENFILIFLTFFFLVKFIVVLLRLTVRQAAGVQISLGGVTVLN